MKKKLWLIFLFLLPTTLQCNEVFSFLTDYEASYGILKILKQYSIDKNIDTNLSFYNAENVQNVASYYGLITSKDSLITQFNKNNNYIVIELPFFDIIALCAEKETALTVKDLSIDDLFTIIKEDYIIVANNGYNSFFPDHLQDFDLHCTKSSQNCNALLINGKTFGITNRTECVNHPKLTVVTQFPEKKIHFSLIINKKYQDFIEYFMQNLDIFHQQNYILEN